MRSKEDVFRGGMASLSVTFNREQSGPLLEVYWTALEALTSEQMAAAFGRAIMECKFFPVPSELLAFSGNGARDIPAEAILAWGAVRSAMDALDVYGNPDFGRLTNAVIRNLGGWLSLCEATLKELEFKRKDFERVYRELADKDPGILNGAPHFGQFGHYPVTVIQIPGLPVEPRSLEAVRTEAGAAMLEEVRKLADAKS